MAIKPEAKDWTVKEQIIEDLVTGLTFQFEIDEESTAPMRLKIYGKFPFGNREIIFDKNGEEAGSGSLVSGHCRPSWKVDLE